MEKIKSDKYKIIVMWVFYTLTYLPRYSYVAALVVIIKDYGVTKALAGLASTIFFIFYASGQIITSIICKKVNRKVLGFIAIIISGIINIIYAFDIPFFVFLILMPILGFFQSTLWLSFSYSLRLNISSKNASKAGAIMGSSTPLGTSICYIISFLCTMFLNYKISFLISGLISLIISFAWISFYNKQFTIENLDIDITNYEKKVLPKTVLLEIILSIFVCLFACILSMGLTNWFPTILNESYEINESYSILISVALLIPGFFASFFSAQINRFIKNINLISLLSFIITIALILAIIIFKDIMPIFLIILIFVVISFLMNLVLACWICIYPFNHKEHMNMLTGAFNFGNHSGSAISTFVLGYIADLYGWNYLFIILLFSSMMPLLLSTFNLINEYRLKARVAD